jgi:hypothetical protein
MQVEPNSQIELKATDLASQIWHIPGNVPMTFEWQWHIERDRCNSVRRTELLDVFDSHHDVSILSRELFIYGGNITGLT